MGLRERLTAKVPYFLTGTAAVSMAYLLSQKYERKRMERLPACREMVAILRRSELARKSLGDFILPIFWLQHLPRIHLRRSAHKMEISLMVEGRQARKNVTAVLTSKTLAEIEASDDPAAARAQYCLPEAEPPAGALAGAARFWRLDALYLHEPDGRKRIALPEPPAVARRADARDVALEAQQRLGLYNQGLTAEALRNEEEQVRMRGLNLERTSRVLYTVFYVTLSGLSLLLYLKANQKRSIAKTQLFSEGVKRVMAKLGGRGDIVFNKTSIGYTTKDRAHFVLQFAGKDVKGSAEFSSRQEGGGWRLLEETLNVEPASLPERGTRRPSS